jgi:hypothetical protein
MRKLPGRPMANRWPPPSMDCPAKWPSRGMTRYWPPPHQRATSAQLRTSVAGMIRKPVRRPEISLITTQRLHLSLDVTPGFGSAAPRGRHDLLQRCRGVEVRPSTDCRRRAPSHAHPRRPPASMRAPILGLTFSPRSLFWTAGGHVSDDGPRRQARRGRRGRAMVDSGVLAGFISPSFVGRSQGGRGIIHESVG